MKRTSNEDLALAVGSVREIEDAYYQAMPEDVAETIRLRNEGWELFKNGDDKQGLKSLEGSTELTVEDGSIYKREQYANNARYAQALAARGLFELGSVFGDRAIAMTPNPLVIPLESDPNKRLILPDQYEVIFTGRLSFVMATSAAIGKLSLAADLAERGIKLATDAGESAETPATKVSKELTLVSILTTNCSLP